MTSGGASQQPDPTSSRPTQASPRASMPMRVFAVGALLVSLVLAGLVSYYASGDPDGLSRVAADKGFDKQQEPHAAADSPLAGYSVKDVDNARLSGGLAGVAGVVVVLLLAGGVAFAVRRRTSEVGNANAPPPGGAAVGDRQ